MRRAKEKEGGELETLNFRGFLYLLKKVDKHQRDCTAPGANIHADFDWDYELRKGMSEFANMHVEKTSGSKIASDFRNKLGKDGLFTITNCKHYSMASRAANDHGKCVWTMLLAAITYPGCPEWCRYTWGQIKRALVELGFTEKWLKRKGVVSALCEGDVRQRKLRRETMLKDMVSLCQEHNVQFEQALSPCDNKGGKAGKNRKPKNEGKIMAKSGVKSEVKWEVKSEVKSEMKSEVKSEVKCVASSSYVKRRQQQRPKADSFGDNGPNASFMGCPNRHRMELELQNSTHLRSFKKSAEPAKTHKMGVMPGRDQRKTENLDEGVEVIAPPPRPPCDEVDLVSPDKSGAGDGTRAQPINFRSPLAAEPPASSPSSASSPGRVSNKRRKLDLADGGGGGSDGGGSDGGGGGGGSGVGGGGVGTTPLLPLLPPYAKWEPTQKGLELVLAAANEEEAESQEEVV